MPHRKYDEHEIARVIERAAELQEGAADRARQAERGLTLAELERVGVESGLDPAFIRAAAAEADAPGPRPDERSFQTTTHVHAERWVPGPLQPEAWEETVAALRRYATGSAGQTERIGRAREWVGKTSLGLEVRATLSPRGSGQRVRVQQHVGYASEAVESLAMIGPFFALFGFAIAGAATESWTAALLGALVVYVLAAAVGFVGDRAWRRAKQRDLDRLAGEVEDAVLAANAEREAAPAWEGGAAEGEAAPLLDLDGLPDAPGGGAAPLNGRVRAGRA